MKGKLIVIEGVDGSGKSTQVKLLKADHKLAFPRYNKLLGKIIQYLLHRKYGQRISQAHQGAKLKGRQRERLINWIGWLENKLFKLPQPDQVIYLKVPAQVTKTLMKSRKKKDMAEKDFAYQKETVKVYEELAKRFNFTVIECLVKNELLSKQAINRKIKTALGIF